MKHPITQARNGAQVYTDLIKSPAAAHIASQPSLLTLVKEVLERTNLTGPKVRMEHDMGRDIGYDFVAETSETDVIFYAQGLREDTFTRFVKNGKPQATHYLTVILLKDESGEYELRATWIGRLSPPTPGSNDETSESKTFWGNHAQIFDRQPVQLRTVTKVCPY